MSKKLRNLRKFVSVEPSFFFYTVTYEVLKNLNANLYLQKSCRFNQTTEPDLSTQCDDEKGGILFVSKINANFYLANFFLCYVFMMFSTAWSDKAGRRRRPLIFLSIIGQILQTLSFILHSYFWTWIPISAAILEVTFECLTGGTCSLLAACQMYICDVVDVNSRTMRLGVLAAIKIICLLIGSGGSGFILRFFGFFYSYVLCFSLSMSALLFGFVFIKDASVPVINKKPFYKHLSLNGVVGSFRVVFRKNLGSKRIIVVLLLVSTSLGYFTVFGEVSVLYLYFRYKFQWDERQYSAFMLYRFTGSTFGTLFTSVVLSKRLKIHDGLIGILTGIFDTLAIIGLLFATQSWQIYLIPLLDVFHGTVLTVGMSFMSKYYDTNELGRLQSVYSVFALMIPFCYPIYNTVFQFTLDIFPAAFCIVSVLLDLVIVLFYGISYVLSKKLKKQEVPIKEEIRTTFSFLSVISGYIIPGLCDS